MPLNIDLHTHSFFSGDGVSSPEDLIAAARAKGLSGIAITDHNTCDAVNYLLEKGLMRTDGTPVNDFLVVPGVEVTTADGHLLCIGAELPYLKGKPAREVCDIVHQRGGLAIPPHPYDLFRAGIRLATLDRKSTRLNSSHSSTSYAVFCLKNKTQRRRDGPLVLHS